jgi:hypothetical protein
MLAFLAEGVGCKLRLRPIIELKRKAHGIPVAVFGRFPVTESPA